MVKNPPGNAGDARDLVQFLGQEDSPGGGKQQTTPVFLPGESHGQRSMAGYSPWGYKRAEHDVATKTTATFEVTFSSVFPPTRNAGAALSFCWSDLYKE